MKRTNKWRGQPILSSLFGKKARGWSCVPSTEPHVWRLLLWGHHAIFMSHSFIIRQGSSLVRHKDAYCIDCILNICGFILLLDWDMWVLLINIQAYTRASRILRGIPKNSRSQSIWLLVIYIIHYTYITYIIHMSKTWTTDDISVLQILHM